MRYSLTKVIILTNPKYVSALNNLQILSRKKSINQNKIQIPELQKSFFKNTFLYVLSDVKMSRSLKAAIIIFLFFFL